jgi:hypothetical protein
VVPVTAVAAPLVAVRLRVVNGFILATESAVFVFNLLHRLSFIDPIP